MTDEALPGHVQSLRRRLAADGVQVDLVQTHISYVLLTPDEVWKLKKPVDLGFLDYTRLEQRRLMCEEEVRLNARLAPDVYLGLQPVDRAGGLEGEPVDFAVRMRRLPADLMLDRCLEAGAVDRDRAIGIGRLLAAFHLGAGADGPRGELGLDAHLRHWEDNFRWLEQFPDLLDGRLVRQCQEYQRAFLSANSELLRERHLERTVDGHGDLRAEHICLLDPPVVFDCIEFSDELRVIDSANDLAFLLMDLEFLGHRPFADAVAESYIYWSHDPTLGSVLDFYRCYRAVVRAKVEAIKSVENEVQEEERQRAARRAAKYLVLARHYANPVRLIIVRGYAASGKSTLAARLATSGAVLLSTDVVRRTVIPEEELGEPRGAAYREGAYSPEHTSRVYQRLVEDALEHLINGRSVVLDGTFLPQAAIDAVTWLRGRWSGPAVALLVDPGEERVRANLQRRAAEPDTSEADVEIYLEQKRRERLVPLPGVFELSLNEQDCELDSQALLDLIARAERWATP